MMTRGELAIGMTIRYAPYGKSTAMEYRVIKLRPKILAVSTEHEHQVFGFTDEQLQHCTPTK